MTPKSVLTKSQVYVLHYIEMMYTGSRLPITFLAMASSVNQMSIIWGKYRFSQTDWHAKHMIYPYNTNSNHKKNIVLYLDLVTSNTVCTYTNDIEQQRDNVRCHWKLWWHHLVLGFCFQFSLPNAFRLHPKENYTDNLRLVVFYCCGLL